MYPGNYNIEWLGYKGGEPVEESPKVGSVARAWQWRERGINPPNQPPNKTVLENIAEDILVQKPLQITSCDLPGFPRSTFLMVFSPDGTKLASTHGNHNIYVSELASGKHVRILRGHPRTPWCIAFHPSHPQLIGSGCLGGQVRVWDIASGGSEVWNVYNETVIASIAFHPREQLLVIATYNELYFWDWSQPAPFTKVSTKNINEKVRYVAFDSLGFKLITGISLWACSSNSNSTPLVTGTGPSNNNSSLGNNGSPGNNGGPGNSAPGNGGSSNGNGGPGNGGPGNGGNGNGGPGNGGLGNGGPGNGGLGNRGDDGHGPDTPGAAQDMIVNSYQTLVQRYDSLVRNYQRLFMVRHRLINTPPLANTIDRGTDPMETYPLESGRLRRRPSRRIRPTVTTAQLITIPPTPGTSREADTSAAMPSNDRAASPPHSMQNSVINWEGFAFSPVSVRSTDSPVTGVQGVPVIRSIASAFRPLNDDRTVRLLPNPFSSTNGSPRQPSTSRTSGIFRGPESALSILRRFSIQSRNLEIAENAAREQAARNAQNGGTANNSGNTENNSGNVANNSGTAPNSTGTTANGTGAVTDNSENAANSTRTATSSDTTASNNLGTTNNSGTENYTRTFATHERTVANNLGTNIESPASNSTTTANTGSVLNNAEGRRNAANVPTAARTSASSLLFSTASPSYIPPPLPTEPPPSRPPPPPEPTPGSSSQRTTDPTDPDGEAHTINESLDLIRDILRDSGTRLLNLITNMSMNILSNSERDESARVPVHVFTGNLRRDFMASSSDSESEHTEVNITRTPNTTFREGLADTNGNQTSTTRPTVETNRPQNTTVPQISNRMTFEPDPNATPSVERMTISDRMTFELDETLNAGPAREGGINVTMSNDRFSVRSQSDRASAALSSSAPAPSPSSSSAPAPSPSPAPAPTPSPAPAPSTSSATAEPQPGPSSAPDTANFDPNVPSTSRDNFWTRGPEIPAAEAIRRVQMGVTALQKHTLQLANMWLRGDRTTMRELRTMWEDLRRRIMALHREAGGRADTPSFYTRSLLERCMILTELTEMTDLSTRPYGRYSRRPARSGDTNQAARPTDTNPAARNGESSQTSRPYIISEDGNQAARTLERSAINCNNPSTLHGEPSTSADAQDSRTTRARAQRLQRNKRLVRLQQAYRWRAEDEVRRRDRNSPPVFRVSHLRSRHRSNLMRSVEQNATRHVIRTRAMKVLSVMFNMMMMCLEERGLSQLIINMLKTLKKALALTCFMMMSNRNMPRPTAAAAPAAQTVQSVESADVVRIQNVEHTGPVNVDDAYDPHSLRVIRYDSEAASSSQPEPKQTASTSSTQTTPVDEMPSPLTNTASQSWSHRLAVQIAAANRNNSNTANTRRDLYIEARRQKALHRTNPTAFPFIRRRIPPVLSHRIPAMRSLPPGRFHHRVSPRSPPPGPDAGPSPAPDQPPDPALPPYDRDNFISLPHIRLRTAARNRFRRLQTIRLYTPSSVREMFALHDSQQENRAEPNRTEDEELEVAFGANAPLLRARGHIHALMAGEGMLPLMQVNDLPPPPEPQPQPHSGQPQPLPGQPQSGQSQPQPGQPQPGQAQPSQAQRLPRIHEYLQPIILAQNAMVVEESEGGAGGGAPGQRRFGGMAGLLDAGIISEALPAPSHRVQAWDFTSGAAPDIADNTKNVVVQRCRIHNDASIDISKDGRLLVALLPVPRLRNTNNWLGEYHVGVYSLEWPRLGQCLHTAVLEQSAVSVALSPTARYLAVGLGSRRFTSSHSRTNIIALLYKLDPLESSSRTGLSPMKELEQYWEHGFTSLNCLRWAPQPGQGLVYANNTGQLIIMS